MVSIKLIFFLCLVLILNGCGITYYSKISWHQAKIIFGKEPIDNYIKNSQTEPAVLEKLLLSKEVLEFAQKNLELNTKSNYTSYYQLEEDAVSYVVNASPQFSIDSYQWNFLLLGNLPYKGFPSKKDAEKEAQDLKMKNYDVFVRGVSAYSTLGYFSDPILSSMIRYKDSDFIELLLHETAHANLYIDAQGDFNEQLASFFGRVATEKYLEYKFGPDSIELKKYIKENEEESLFRDFLSNEVLELKKKYTDLKDGNIDTNQKTEKKSLWISEIQKKYKTEIKPKLKHLNFDFIESTNLNNARLSLYLTYNQIPKEFSIIYQNENQNLKAFLIFLQALKKSKNPLSDLQKLIKEKYGDI